jgi:cytochrome P450 family 3 subfamily A
MSAADLLAQLQESLELSVDFLSKIPTWMLILLPTVYAYYKYCTWNFGIFKKLGVSGPRPLPVFGSTFSMMSNGIVEHDLSMKKYGTIVGIFQGRTPAMMIFDVEIIKQICVKDFANFTNRFNLPFDEYPLRKMLTMIKDDHWRNVRNVLTPTFSSGKLRKMNQQIHNCSDTLITNLLSKAAIGETFDFRELCGAFTMDVIASTAFGLQIDSHNDPNNQFVKMGKKTFMFSFTSPAMIIFFFFPFLLKPLGKIGFTIFPADARNFFVSVIQKAMEDRKHDTKSNQVDFLQLMMNAHLENDEIPDDGQKTETLEMGKEEKIKRRGLTEEEVIAQGLLFFIAGFETTANTLSLLGYSLATNPECQEKLIAEIDKVMKTHDKVDYDTVKGMPYLDMCISETLRLYPAGPRTDRVAANDITINGVFIPKGMNVTIPIYVLHMDPNVWPEPNKFIPERFTTEQKESRDPYYYLPFGAGPRSCVGMRLALTELKISTVTILQKMKFVVAPETQIPLKLNKVSMKGEDGIKIRMEKRC